MRLCEFEMFVYSRVVIEDEVVFRMGRKKVFFKYILDRGVSI